MDIVTIDFETYYDKEFSLSKLTTEEYVRDKRFEIIGVGIKVNDGPADWYSGSDPGKFLRSLDYSNKAILAHNTMFDGAILSWRLGIKPRLWLDTMSMAKPANATTTGVSLKALCEYFGLGTKGNEVINALGKRRADFTKAELDSYADYCIQDTNLTYKLFRKIMKNGFPASELQVIHSVIRMFTEPKLELDQNILRTHLADVQAKKQALMATLRKFTGDPTDEALKTRLMSAAKMAELLTTLGVEVPTKTSKTTGKVGPALAKTDEEFKALLHHPNLAVQALVSARMGMRSTLEETRTESLLSIAERGALPVQLRYYGAHTGRLSGDGGINLQNLGRKSPIRSAIRAPKGKVVIACDSSQIEARMLAYLAGQDDLVQAFREGRDVYSEFATTIYGRKVTKADKTERFVGKTCVAEGTLILTDRGAVPIEEITTADRVWDGVEWVNHDGVVYQGFKDVITYAGLTATADHGVFTDSGPVPFGLAASRLEALTITGVGGEAVRVSSDYFLRDHAPREEHIRVHQMYEVWRREADTGKAHVYDILNAGPRYRYTAANILIFNCILGLGYGMGSTRFQETLAIGNGGISVKMGEAEAKSIVYKYRDRYPHIKALWDAANNMLSTMCRGGTGEFTSLRMPYSSDGIVMPNGLALNYNMLDVGSSGIGWRYVSNKNTLIKVLQARVSGGSLEDIPWTRLYGAKVIENITQALARIVITEQMSALGAHYDVVLQVHDELVFLADESDVDNAVATVTRIMSTPPKWAPGLPVACEHGVGPSYGEAK